MQSGRKYYYENDDALRMRQETIQMELFEILIVKLIIEDQYYTVS